MAWVSTAVAGPPTGEAISLYFTLKAGEKADLEVIATAALEWLESARAAAREIEPSAQIRVELVDADESSLRLNTVLDWVESQLEKVDKGGGSYPRLKKLAIFTEPWDPIVVRRGDALGLLALTNMFAETVAPGLSNRVRDGRWVTSWRGVLCDRRGVTRERDGC
jgi:hypothetical protein